MSFCSISNFNIISRFPTNKNMFYAVNTSSQEEVIAKMSREDIRDEAKICSCLSDNEGFPEFYFYGIKDGKCVLVLQKLGKSLRQLFIENKLKFSLKTVLMIGYQLLCRIECMHSHNIVHGRINPDHIMIESQTKSKSNVLFLVDFANAEILSANSNTKATHYYLKQENLKDEFMSVNAQGGQPLSYKDDLESLAYVLIYFLNNRLPWSNLPNTFDKKCSTLAQDLCKDLPKEFETFVIGIKKLVPGEFPHYAEYRKLFKNLLLKCGYVFDDVFDWNLKKEIAFHFENQQPVPTPQIPFQHCRKASTYNEGNTHFLALKRVHHQRTSSIPQSRLYNPQYLNLFK